MTSPEPPMLTYFYQRPMFVGAVADVMADEYDLGAAEAQEAAEALVARYAARQRAGEGFTEEEPAVLGLMEAAAVALSLPQSLPHMKVA